VVKLFKPALAPDADKGWPGVKDLIFLALMALGAFWLCKSGLEGYNALSTGRSSVWKRAACPYSTSAAPLTIGLHIAYGKVRPILKA
jgi:hypothetical protein